MDEQLAAIYGTGQVEHDEDDLEKTAAAELLVKLAAEEGLDLDNFSDDEIAGMVNELQGDTAQDEGQEKFAEADFLGRVMAHSMVQELNEIEKQAKVGPGLLQRIGLKTGVSYAAGGQRAVGKAKKMLAAAKTTAEKQKALDVLRRAKAVRGAGLKRVGKRVGLPAAGVGAVGVGAAAAGKEKKSSAIDALAEQRAYEMLEEAGYGQEKVSVDQVVEHRALEMLDEAGYPVEWNE